jgi:hypothetical protein
LQYRQPAARRIGSIGAQPQYRATVDPAISQGSERLAGPFERELRHRGRADGARFKQC